MTERMNPAQYREYVGASRRFGFGSRGAGGCMLEAVERVEA